MSNTASANVFSSDPAKKFDVTFSVEMRDLLAALGAKPETINSVMAQAEANRKKAPMSMPPMVMAGMAGMAGMPGGGMPAGMNGGMPGGMPDQGQGQGQPAQMMPSAAATQSRKGGGGQAGRSLLTPPGAAPAKPQTDGAKPAAAGPDAGGAGRKRGRREEGGPSPGASPGGGRFTLKDIENAVLPPPPDQDSQLDVLLRPGLLADVEIIVEKIPNAVHVPTQAVFEKDGKPIVYVQKADGKFEAREVKLAKRSESTMVIASGLKVDEIIALADPTAKPGSKKGGAEDKKGGAMSSLPGGKQ